VPSSAEELRERGRRAVPSVAEELRERWRRLRLPAGLPPLTRSLRFAVVLLDEEDAGFTLVVEPDWSVTPADQVHDVVHDGALAAPVELVHAICTGALDPGHAAAAGALNGTMATQSVLAYLLEAVAIVDVAAAHEGGP
jgi:hypothetical protein